MKFAKITAMFAAATFVASVGVAHAQINKDDAKCRGTAQKNTGKLTATASKAIVGCWKSVLGGKIGFTNCNDSATADTKGKITKAVSKVTDAVGLGAKTKCELPLHAAAMAEYQDCPSPGSAGTGMTDFGQVGTCLAEIGQVMADNMHRYAMNPTATQVAAILAHPNTKQIAKCGSSIQKNYSKLIATIGKVEGKEQQNCDKKGVAGLPCNGYNYSQTGSDPKQKISGTVGKMNAAITKDCGPLSDAEFALLGTCGRSSADVGACLEKTATDGSGSVTQVSFDMPGVCPSFVYATVKPGQTNASAPGAGDGTTTTPTKVDAGWTGFGHNNDFVDFTAAGSISCTDNACGDCSPSIACLTGNCRCNNDVTVHCDEPLVADADDCGGAICNVYTGPPLPAVVEGAATCIVNELTGPLSGSADVGTGEANIVLDTAATVFLGINQLQPCPTCAAGSCVGGDRDGQPCSGNDGTSPTFGGTSIECLPELSENISGSGLQISLDVSTTPADLDSFVGCTFAGGLSGLDCPCAVCTGDPTVPCNSDGDCAGVGGTCSSIGSGVHTQPNSCNDLLCTVDSATGEGECTSPGNENLFCDGITNANGGGIITCSTNGDCGAVSAGNCTISQNQKCFGSGSDSIAITGTFGAQGGGVFGSNFCFPPTNNAGINGAGGSPGPGRARIAFDFDARCSDGTTPYRLGGANCP